MGIGRSVVEQAGGERGGSCRKRGDREGERGRQGGAEVVRQGGTL